MSYLRSDHLIDYVKRLYTNNEIDVDELEHRIRQALTGEATDQEWINACRDRRRTSRGPVSLADVDAILKAAYTGPIQETA